MKEAASVPLRKMGGCRWEIPQDYDPGMRVPGIIFSDEKLLPKIREDQSLKQVANVAHLPGIVRYSLAMPDIHWGYGFPIGGVAATDPDEGGVISPGGIGFDVNCLSGETKILQRHGYHRTIEEIVKKKLPDAVRCYELQRKNSDAAEIGMVLWKKPDHQVVELVTTNGRRVVASEDHPFLTPSGMKTVRELERGDRIAVDPFEGVPYEDPGNEILVDEEDVRRFLSEKEKLGGNAASQIFKALRQRNLLPLRRSHPALPVLIKALGYVTGDGTLYFTGKTGKGFTWFFGKAEDLREIQRDLSPWFKVSPIDTRRRTSRITTPYRTYEFVGETSSVKITSSSFATLLAILGCPVGNKANQDYEVPAWLLKAPLWHKRLFLAAYFGAELQTPRAMVKRNRNFPCPLLTVQKNESCVTSGRRFLEQIGDLLKEFGVTPLKIHVRPEGVMRKGGLSVRLRLAISSRPENLLALYTRIGFEYHRRKRAEAAVVASYQRAKLRIWRNRELVAAKAVEFQREKDLGAEGILEELNLTPFFRDQETNLRFVERALYGNPDAKLRVPMGFPTFEEYRAGVTEGLEGSGLVWDTIEDFEPRFDVDKVYDITVAHPDHNFIANGFVVHNCGVRLVRTSLTEADVKPRIRELVAQLFNRVPCGVGQSGEVRVSREETKRLLVQGTRWAVQHGYGVPEDIEHTEARGVLEGADPDAVSNRAYERGRDQLGTLGSGNHFLEVQVVDKIFDDAAAAVLGLRENQITVMIHSGSRGFGYQVCDDFLELMRHSLEKYKIKLPDVQLACAPVKSPEAERYLGAMRCAANYAWNNRQCLMQLARNVFEKFFGRSWQDLGMNLIYDVAHNIAKFERYRINGKEKMLCIHRKGATRAFPPGHPELPKDYQPVGQPVIIPGDMGRNSYVLTGTAKAVEETFGTTCHGAGRAMSRAAAVRDARGRSIEKELEAKGIIVMGRGRNGVAEEQPAAYKDVNDVVDVVDRAGIAKKVARMRPIGVIKG